VLLSEKYEFDISLFI